MHPGSLPEPPRPKCWIAPPRPLAAVPEATLRVAIGCPAESVDATLSWRLDNPDFDEAMGEDVRQRAQELARVLGGRAPKGTAWT